jgi:hypothetical protein
MALIVDTNPEMDGAAVGIDVRGDVVGCTLGKCEGADVIKLIVPSITNSGAVHFWIGIYY